MSPSQLSLLLTDDDPHFQFFLEHVLSGCNIPHTVTTLKDGEQLIEFLSKPANVRYNCLLLDMNMPRKNGIEVLEEMRKKKLGAGIPVIVMSQASAPSYIKQIMELGAAAYMEKPFGLEEFKVFAKKIVALAEEKSQLKN